MNRRGEHLPDQQARQKRKSSIEQRDEARRGTSLGCRREMDDRVSRKARGRGKEEERGSRGMEEAAWKRGRRARNRDWLGQAQKNKNRNRTGTGGEEHTAGTESILSPNSLAQQPAAPEHRLRGSDINLGKF